MKNNKEKNQIATSEALNLDPETRGILQTVSDRLDKTPTGIIKEAVYSIDRLFSWNNSDGNSNNKENLALTFDSTIKHLHLLPQIAESVSLLSGRDTDVVNKMLYVLV